MQVSTRSTSGSLSNSAEASIRLVETVLLCELASRLRAPAVYAYEAHVDPMHAQVVLGMKAGGEAGADDA